LEELRNLQALAQVEPALAKALAERIAALEAELATLDYHFDRRFLFRILRWGIRSLQNILALAVLILMSMLHALPQLTQFRLLRIGFAPAAAAAW